MSERVTKTTCPRDCYDACGILVVERDGRRTQVRGDPDHPISRGNLCGKCAIAYNGAWQDPDQRLTTPLRRIGPKGEGRFEPISWDDALAEIAGKLKPLVDGGEAHRILTGHYTGTCSAIAGGFPMRFLGHIGAREIDPDTICNMAGHYALNYLMGASAKGFDPRTARDTKCLVVWGANPHASAPHAYRYWLQEQPGTLVVIDPVRTPTAEIADIHLQLRPGSDAALAFAFMHVIRRDGLLDADFIRDHTVGFEQLEPMLDACTPAWGEAQTGIDAKEIERVARLYGAGPAMIWLGQALQRQPAGGNIFRACATLPAVTGNIGKPGTGIYYLNGKGNLGLDMSYVSMPSLAKDAPRPVSHMDLVETLANPAEAAALLLWNINIAASNPRQAELLKVLAREDLFTVVIDLFQTDSADFADIVLPAASFLEFDDLVGSYMNLSLSAQAKAIEPPGEALPNQEIFRRLARVMDLDTPALHESDANIIAHVLEGSAFTWDELTKRGTIPFGDEPVILYEDLKFNTPSGKLEIASERAVKRGWPATAQPWADAPSSGERLRLLSPASAWHMNSSYDNDPAIAKQAGMPSITLHPADAAARGLKDGEAVRVWNEIGSLRLQLHVDDVIPPGVALTHKGRWPRGQAGHANVNALFAGAKSDMGQSTTVHAVQVKVASA